MSVAAMTMDDHKHTTIINSEIIQNDDLLLHKIKNSQQNELIGGIGIGGGIIMSVAPPASPNQNLSAIQPTSAVTSFEQHCRLLEDENQSLKVEQTRLQQQCSDAQRRERILMRRLANKEQEFQDYVSQIAEYKSAQAPGPAALRSALLDPAVNLLFEKLKKELQATKSKLEETQNELSAWKFTPDSNTGKRLMAKCRLLYQENEELGKMTSNGRLAKLEGELAMQKSFSEEVKKSQSELDDFLQELDEDVEGMQSTILFLQQELKSTRDRIQHLEKENYQLKNDVTLDVTDKPITDITKNFVPNGKGQQQQAIASPPHIHLLPTIKENEELEIISNNTATIDSEMETQTQVNYSSNTTALQQTTNKTVNSEFYNGAATNEPANNGELTEDPLNSGDAAGDGCDNIVDCSVITKRLRKRNYDSDSSECGSINGAAGAIGGRGNKRIKKKTRRSSVLSIDLNEEDTQITAEPSDDENSGNQRVVTRRKSARNQHNGSGETN